MLRSWGTIQHSVTVRSALDVAQPPGPVRIAHQVGVESDGVVAGIACRQNFELWIRCQQGLGTRVIVVVILPDLGYGGNSPLKYSLSRTCTKSTPADG